MNTPRASGDGAACTTFKIVNISVSKIIFPLAPRPPLTDENIHVCQSSSGDVAGVGVSLSVDKDRDLPLIVGVEAGTPAEEAGLKVP